MTNPIVPSIEGIRARFATLLQGLRATWAGTLEQRVSLVQLLQEYLHHLPRDEQEAIVAECARRSAIHPERFTAILNLASLVEIKRALQTGAYKQHIRLTDEQHFPYDGWIGRYLLHFQESECPLAFHFWSAVAAIGAVCGRRIYFDMGKYLVFPNHYTVLVAPSGMKKSLGLYSAEEVLKRMNQLLSDQPTDRRVRFLPRKVTPEKLVEMLQSRPTVVAVGGKAKTIHGDSVGWLGAPELVSLLGKHVWGSDAIVGLLTDLYDCPREWEAATLKRQTESLKNVALSFIGCSTVEWVRSAITEDMMSGGFTGRCMWIYRTQSSRVYPKPEPNDPIIEEGLASFLASVAVLPETEAKLSPEADEFYTDWYHEHKNTPLTDSHMGGYYERKHNHLLKLGIVLSLSGETFPTITQSQLAVALTVLNFEERIMPQCFEEVSAHPDARDGLKVLRVIRNYGGAISHGELFRRCHTRIGSSKRLMEVMESLREAGFVKFVAGPRGGKQYVSVPIGTEDDGN